jgi:uncharacterized protein
MRPILIVPGYTDSGPEHWQSLWEKELPDARRVEQRDWEAPDRHEWVAALDQAITSSETPPLLVAHSLGCLTVVHWAAGHHGAVAGALLVAPPDVERADTPGVLCGFAPLPGERLRFPTVLVTSDDDPYLRLERARELAGWWGSRLEVIAGAGHLNTAAGYGAWPEGRRFLADLCDGVAAR